MSVAQKLNKFAKLKETKPLSALEYGKKYQVLAAKKFATTFGEAVLLEFPEFRAFLGKRFCNMSDEEVNELNTAAETKKLYLIAKGKIGKTVDIEFSEE